MTAKNVDNGCGMFARVFFQIAYSLMNYQCQHDRQYPSRFTLKMLQYSADHGHVRAMGQLGSLLYRCGVGRADKRSGVEYLRQAAKGGDIEAQFLLGAAYAEGQMVRQDDKTAVHWLALAADSGHGEAADLLQSVREHKPSASPQEKALV